MTRMLDPTGDKAPAGTHEEAPGMCAIDSAGRRSDLETPFWPAPGNFASVNDAVTHFQSTHATHSNHFTILACQNHLAKSNE